MWRSKRGTKIMPRLQYKRKDDSAYQRTGWQNQHSVEYHREWHLGGQTEATPSEVRMAGLLHKHEVQ